MLECVSAVRAPRLRKRLRRSGPRVETQAIERMPNAEVGSEKGVWIAKGAHGDVARSPRAYAGEGEKAIFGRAPVGTRMQLEVARCDRTRDAGDRANTRGG